MKFEITHRGMPEASTCFPVGYDTSNLTEITCIGDSWAKFLSHDTHEIIDCADFYQQYLEQQGVN